MATHISRRLFNVDDYHRMVDAGILSEGDKLELIRGEVLALSPIGPPHNGAVMRAHHILGPLVRDQAIVCVQGTVRLSPYDEPQPDLVLLRPREDFYTTKHAGPQDIILIIEIADCSLDFDRTVKGALYAESGVAEYWVADIPNDCLWVYLDIHAQSYRNIRKYVRSDLIYPALLPECPVRVDTFLP